VRILNILSIATLLNACGTAKAADAQASVPTETDLHAVYCIPVVQRRISYEETILAFLRGPGGNQFDKSKRQFVIDGTQKELDHMKSALIQLQAYLKPVLDHRDLAPLMAAQKRADADLGQLEKQIDQCTSICSPPGEERTTAEVHQCAKSCGDQSLRSRTTECENPTWLPASEPVIAGHP
jgi:hypothetical protein